MEGFFSFLQKSCFKLFPVLPLLTTTITQLWLDRVALFVVAALTFHSLKWDASGTSFWRSRWREGDGKRGMIFWCFRWGWEEKNGGSGQSHDTCVVMLQDSSAALTMGTRKRLKTGKSWKHRGNRSRSTSRCVYWLKINQDYKTDERTVSCNRCKHFFLAVCDLRRPAGRAAHVGSSRKTKTAARHLIVSV